MKIKQLFIAEDDKEFGSEKECLAYEKSDLAKVRAIYRKLAIDNISFGEVEVKQFISATGFIVLREEYIDSFTYKKEHLGKINGKVFVFISRDNIVSKEDSFKFLE